MVSEHEILDLETSGKLENEETLLTTWMDFEYHQKSKIAISVCLELVFSIELCSKHHGISRKFDKFFLVHVGLEETQMFYKNVWQHQTFVMISLSCQRDANTILEFLSFIIAHKFSEGSKSRTSTQLMPTTASCPRLVRRCQGRLRCFTWENSHPDGYFVRENTGLRVHRLILRQNTEMVVVSICGGSKFKPWTQLNWSKATRWKRYSRTSLLRVSWCWQNSGLAERKSMLWDCVKLWTYRNIKCWSHTKHDLGYFLRIILR